MIMPAPFYPSASRIDEDMPMMNRSEFISALVKLGQERYHSLHPFHKLLHNGKLNFKTYSVY